MNVPAQWSATVRISLTDSAGSTTSSETIVARLTNFSCSLESANPTTNPGNRRP